MNARRPAYTLIELVIASASASVLVVGLSASLYVAGRALDVDEGVSLRQQAASGSLAVVEAELAEATRFTELKPSAVAFSVPDRDADGLPERVRYSWSGVAGDPLLREYNGGSPLTVLGGVQTMSFTGLTRSVTALDVTVPAKPPWPIIESFTTEHAIASTTSTLPTPSGVAEGDLLIAAFATDNDRIGTMTPPGGWSEIDLDGYDGKVTFGVWWRLATASEPAGHEWRWDPSEDAIGVIIRITNQWPGNPVTSFAATGGKNPNVDSLGTGVTLDHSLILRLGGFDNAELEGATDLDGHADLYVGDADGKVSIAAASSIQPTAGSCPDLTMSQKKAEDYRTVTLVIAPKQN